MAAAPSVGAGGGRGAQCHGRRPNLTLPASLHPTVSEQWQEVLTQQLQTFNPPTSGRDKSRRVISPLAFVRPVPAVPTFNPPTSGRETSRQKLQTFNPPTSGRETSRWNVTRRSWAELSAPQVAEGLAVLLVPLAVSVGSSGFVFWLLPGLLRLSRRLASLAIAKQKRRRWPSEAQGGNQIPPFSGMAEWQSIPSRRKPKASKASASAHPSEDLLKFLAEFKTKECPKKERHGWKQCEYFHHQAKDRRRNPYKDPYLPEDEWNVTGVEKAYHPVIFRTQLCESLARGAKTCQYGSWCAFAHAVQQLREDPSVQYERYTEQFADRLFPKVQRKTLQDYVGTAPPSAAPLTIRKVESVAPLLSRPSGQQTQGLLLKPHEAQIVWSFF
ncbi:hypothetical protein AK812_SmicGene31102 [Symbiodinium microadriaticum]|uniref:C3H1-type domain-containing protein n=1 Tax=Symbiodinium microadriaticum TaxID=2951 RepID=A0A1Q9CXL2_SYMMI|nr:hypothetical protein AK812_SmicGene31102 [Symbiodinium microadriaticum]